MYLSIYLSIYLYLYLYVCASIYIYIHIYVYIQRAYLPGSKDQPHEEQHCQVNKECVCVYVSIYLSIYLSLFISIRMSLFISIRMCIYIYIHIYICIQRAYLPGSKDQPHEEQHCQVNEKEAEQKRVERESVFVYHPVDRRVHRSIRPKQENEKDRVEVRVGVNPDND